MVVIPAADISQAIVVIGVAGWVVGLITVPDGGQVVEEIVGDVGRVTQPNGVERDAGSVSRLGEITGIFSISLIQAITRSRGAVGHAIGEQNLYPDSSWAPDVPRWNEFGIGSVNGSANVGRPAR